MYFTTAIVALMSIGSAFALPNPFNVPTGLGYQTSAGSTVNLTWTPTTSGTISLQLRDGNAAYLNNGTYIAQGLSNSGQYTWNVPSNIVRGSSYAIEIIDDSDPTQVNFTPQFNIDSTNLYSSTASVSSTSGSASMTASGMSSMTSGSASTTTSGASTSSGASSSMSGSTTGTTSSRTTTTTGAAITANSAARATAVAGLIGAIAFGAIAL